MKRLLWITPLVLVVVMVGCSKSDDGEPTASTTPEPEESTTTSYDPAELIISRETTYITGPLNADGTVNYYQYFDDKASAGVTPETNAAIGLI